MKESAPALSNKGRDEAHSHPNSTHSRPAG